MKSYSPFKIIFAACANENWGRLSADEEGNKQHFDNATHWITIQRLFTFSTQAAPSASFSRALASSTTAVERCSSVTQTAAEEKKKSPSRYECSGDGESENICVGLVHPYVSKIAKFSSVRQTTPRFFRGFIMRPSQTTHIRRHHLPSVDFKRRFLPSINLKHWGSATSHRSTRGIERNNKRERLFWIQHHKASLWMCRRSSKLTSFSARTRFVEILDWKSTGSKPLRRQTRTVASLSMSHDIPADPRQCVHCFQRV